MLFLFICAIPHVICKCLPHVWGPFSLSVMSFFFVGSTSASKRWHVTCHLNCVLFSISLQRFLFTVFSTPNSSFTQSYWLHPMSPWALRVECFIFFLGFSFGRWLKGEGLTIYVSTNVPSSVSSSPFARWEKKWTIFIPCNALVYFLLTQIILV